MDVTDFGAALACRDFAESVPERRADSVLLAVREAMQKAGFRSSDEPLSAEQTSSVLAAYDRAFAVERARTAADASTRRRVLIAVDVPFDLTNQDIATKVDLRVGYDATVWDSIDDFQADVTDGFEDGVARSYFYETVPFRASA